MTIAEATRVAVILAEARYRTYFHDSRLPFADCAENLQNEYLSNAARDIWYLTNAGYDIVPSDPEMWHMIASPKREVECPLCGAVHELPQPESYVTCSSCEAHVPASRIVREGWHGPICDECGGRR